ncbi:MAG TPA: hypothetical protein VM509_03255, partial [Planctomycetota bacterium]|nr:hypothetical protein [Planctomycetota bacterium]
MIDLRPIAIRGRWNSFLVFAAFAMTLFGIKLWLIGTYGNSTPLWDQWEAEASRLYRPYLDGTLRWSILLEAHNEHRIFTHRVLSLALFVINKTWNPLFQMVVNALVHIFALGLGIAMLTRVVGREHLLALILFCLLLFGIPFSWENTLCSFQAQFYLVLLFSLCGIWFLASALPLSVRWWVGVACAVLAFLSMASGVLVPAAAAVVGLVWFASKRRRTSKQLIAVLILCGLFVLGMLLTPGVFSSNSTDLKATSLAQFFDAWGAGLGWPIASSFIAALARNLPALVFLGFMLRNRPVADDRRWFLLALVVWVFAQSVTMAYGRAVGSLASRYLDMFAFGVLVNFACLISVTPSRFGRWRSGRMAACGAWVVAVVISLGLDADGHLPAQLAERHTIQRAHELNTRNYVVTNDFAWLKDKSFLEVPFFVPRRLAVLLSFPTIRSFLPAEISPPLIPSSIETNPLDAFVEHGCYPTTPRRADWTLGSYTSRGDAAIGRASICFDSMHEGAELAIPLAGYPSNPDCGIEVEQNGRRRS